MLLDIMIEVSVAANTASHYKKLGYNVPTKIDKKGRTVYALGEKIMVKQCDLPHSSRNKVKVQCDYCKQIYETAYYNYIIGKKKDIKKDACENCKVKKTNDTLLMKYGEFNPMKIEKVKEKVANTCLERYGCKSVFESNEIKEKITNTMISKYGVENSSQLEEVIEKRKKTNMLRYGATSPCGNKDIANKVKSTNLERYGCVSTLQDPKINEKARKTCMEKYGCAYPGQSPEIREKMNKTLYKNKTAPSSCQQNYIHSIYGGELNYPIQKYCIDICVIDDKMAIEYSGSGHWLSIKYGTVTEDEFKRKEIIRSSYIKKEGYFLMTIECPTDMLPSEKVLESMYKESLEYFRTTNHSWRTYYVEEGMYRDAEHIEKAPYDYGELKKMKNPA